MSLISALNIGSSALATQQAALQVTSNNIANAGNADYTRQSASITSNPDHQVQSGIFLGSGINLTAVNRQIDNALVIRLRSSTSDAESADTTQQWLGRVESVFNELSDDDLSTQMSTFFNSWSNLANSPQDVGLRQVVLQNGASLGKFFNDMRGQMSSIAGDASDQLKALAGNADDLSKQVADLNSQITVAEGGTGGEASGLRDQRDAVLKQLSQLMDIHTVQDGSSVNVYIGSQPLVAGTMSRGVAIRPDPQAGAVLTFKNNGAAIPVSGGQMGALVAIQSQINDVGGQIDSIAGSLIFELNKVHASGQGLQGFNSLTSANAVADPTTALGTSGLANMPATGSFVIHIKSKSTGQEIASSFIKVDANTTLNDLAAQIDGVNYVSSSVSGGKLNIAGDSSDIQFSFSDDGKGVLAALGMNTFFTGQNAQDIAVNSLLTGNPSLLAAATNGKPGDNQSALAIASLESAPLGSLGGNTLKATYQSIVNGVAVSISSAKTNAAAAGAVRDTLENQRQALSGVSMDEESINLMKQQQAYQGAARLVSAIDEMMKTLLAMT